MGEIMQLYKPYQLVRQCKAYLRRKPIVRGIAYLGMAAVTLEGIWRIRTSIGPSVDERLHLEALPALLALTYAYVRLRPEDRAPWDRVPLRSGMVQTLQGMGLATGAFLAWMGIAASKGWVSAPIWGWESSSSRAVAQSLGVLTVEYLAVAWNEELIFRGYLYDTWRPAMGQTATIGVLVVLFALYHGVGRRQVLGLVGMAAAGMMLTLFRLRSDAIWLPFGYHWGWNVLQTAIFGPADGAASIRPLHVHGPSLWVGRPGHPEPGLLSTLIMLAVAFIVWFKMQRGGTQRYPAASLTIDGPFQE
jgi:membrane protease YdiL (CAAX protease family)